MRVFVTGGAGFIGSHLVERLTADGHEVRILDDFSTSNPDNLRACASEASVLDSDLVNSFIRHSDIVFHLAAAVGVRLIAEEPIRTLTTNIQGAENVLAACAVHGKRVVIASSSEVYGQRDDAMPLHEDDDRSYGPTTERRWAYAESKAVDEFLALAYRDEHSLDVRIARLFNTVGPRQTGRYGMVLPRFAEQAVAGRDIEVYGDGEQTRSFCHVSDTVEGLMRLGFADELPHTIYNLGNPHNHVSINALAKEIRWAGNSQRGGNTAGPPPSEIVHVPHQITDMRHRRPDIGRAYADLGWMPQVPLHAIVEGAVQEAREKAKVLSEA